MKKKSDPAPAEQLRQVLVSFHRGRRKRTGSYPPFPAIPAPKRFRSRPAATGLISDLNQPLDWQDFDGYTLSMARPRKEKRSSLNRRKLIGAVALGALLLLALAVRYIAGIPQEDWGLWWRVAFVSCFFVAFFMACYDRKNLPKKTWDFNPKRGFLYFLLGWIIFPLAIAVNATSGGSLTLSAMVVGTLIMSVFVGIVGIFTENVGV